jgi:hypothetical protein
MAPGSRSMLQRRTLQARSESGATRPATTSRRIPRHPGQKDPSSRARFVSARAAARQRVGQHE